MYLLTLATGELRQLTSGAADVHRLTAGVPAADGSHWSLNRDGAADLYLMKVASGEMNLLRAANGWHSLPQWRSDGHWLTVEFESPATLPDIWRVDATTGEAHPITFSTPPALAAAGMVEPEFVHLPQQRRRQHSGLAVPTGRLHPPTRPARPSSIPTAGRPTSTPATSTW